GRHAWLLGAERERGPAEVEPPTAHEHDERGCVHRPRDAPARHPDPAAVPVHPAAVVERREAPWGVVDPGPAPRLHPYPTAVAIRRPSHDRGTGRPYVTVVRRVAPLAVVVEIFVADRLARHVLRRARVIPAAVARGAPVLPVVRPRRVADVVAGRVAARDDGLVP